MLHVTSSPVMSTVVSRSSKACENCRRIKKRCRPPFPCASCIRSGASCTVRSKARPMRLSKHQQTHESPAAPEQNLCTGMRAPSLSLSSTPPEASHSAFKTHQSHMFARDSAVDPYELVCSLVAPIIPNTFDLEDIWNLSEPQPSNAVVPSGSAQNSAYTSTNSSMLTQVTLSDIHQMLDSHSARLLPHELFDLSSLKDASANLFRCNPGALTLGDINLGHLSIPLDHLSFLFAFLAASSFSRGDERISREFFTISTRASNDYAKESTTALLSALFLQHICILQTGTANRTRAIVTNAIQVAQDLKIHQAGADTSPRSLRLYLLLCFSDQYCAFSHNTAPYIRIADSSDRVFEPLLRTDHQLHSLIRLISLNNIILHKLNTKPYTYENVIDLESTMSNVSSTIGSCRPDQWHSGERRASHYEILVQIHILWSRMILRLPMIQSGQYWIASLSACIRAAQMLLSIYFSIAAPSIRVIATSNVPLIDERLPRTLQEMAKLPPTWRQVHRIVTSALVMFYALWKGEASEDEVARSSAMALLLLEYQRTRWGSNVDGPARSIKLLASFTEIQIRPCMDLLVPSADPTFLDWICADGKAGSYHRKPASPASSNGQHRPQDMPLNYVEAVLGENGNTEEHWMELPLYGNVPNTELLSDFSDLSWYMDVNTY